MTDAEKTALRALAERFKPHWESPTAYRVRVAAPLDIGEAFRDFSSAAHPAAVLALLDEVERLHTYLKEARVALATAREDALREVVVKLEQYTILNQNDRTRMTAGVLISRVKSLISNPQEPQL